MRENACFAGGGSGCTNFRGGVYESGEGRLVSFLKANYRVPTRLSTRFSACRARILRLLCWFSCLPETCFCGRVYGGVLVKMSESEGVLLKKNNFVQVDVSD